MLRSLLALSATLAVVNGFHVAPLGAVRPRSVSVFMGVAESAANCLEEGCSIDTVSELLAELKTESAGLNKAGEAASERNKQVIMLIGQLEVLNLDPAANQGEIEKLVGAAARSFSTVDGFDFPGEPLGYSGTPGSTTTAGKSLD